MKTNIRELVKELLENENLIVNYNELNDGGFDLSVRINDEALNTAERKTDISYDKDAKQTTSFDTFSCEGCDIYEEMKQGKMVVNDKCSFCSKNLFKITCGDTYGK